MDEGFLVVRYLYEQRLDGRFIPSVSVQLPGKAEAIIITDPEGRTYRDLNRALEMDFWLSAAGTPSTRPTCRSWSRRREKGSGKWAISKERRVELESDIGEALDPESNPSRERRHNFLSPRAFKERSGRVASRAAGFSEWDLGTQNDPRLSVHRR